MARTSIYGAGVAAYMAAVVIGSTVLTMAVCDWGFTDSFYYVAQTLWTVGYGDLTPPGDEGMMLSIVVILFGTVGVASALGVIGSAILDHHVRRKSRLDSEMERALVRISSVGRAGTERRIARRRWIMSRDLGMLIASVTSLAVISMVGMLLFAYLEGWDLLTSLYFTVYTIATVGYGTVPVTEGTRVFVAVFIVVCGTLALACVGAISNWVVATVQRRSAESRLESEAEAVAQRVGTGAEDELREIREDFRHTIRRIRGSLGMGASPHPGMKRPPVPLIYTSGVRVA